MQVLEARECHKKTLRKVTRFGKRDILLLGLKRTVSTRRFFWVTTTLIRNNTISRLRLLSALILVCRDSLKPKCLRLELKCRFGAIFVGLNNFSVILRRPVIIIHWSRTGLGHNVNRWLGDTKNMKVFGRTGVRIYHPPHKSQNTIHIDLIGLDTECAWRGGQNVNMDLLDVANARVRFGIDSSGSKSLVRRWSLHIDLPFSYWRMDSSALYTVWGRNRIKYFITSNSLR